MKLVTLQINVRVDESVDAAVVAQAIGDELRLDSWNWDVSYPYVMASRIEADEEDDPSEPECTCPVNRSLQSEHSLTCLVAQARAKGSGQGADLIDAPDPWEPQS